MSRIEIPMKEYNGLKNKIKQLEDKLADMSKEMSAYKERNSDIIDAINDLSREGILNRIFNWKNIINSLVKELNGGKG